MGILPQPTLSLRLRIPPHHPDSFSLCLSWEVRPQPTVRLGIMNAHAIWRWKDEGEPAKEENGGESGGKRDIFVEERASRRDGTTT